MTALHIWSVTEAFTVDPCGEPHRTRRTEKLEGLRQRDSDISDGYVVQDVCQGNAAYCGNDQNQIDVHFRVKRSANFPKYQRERKQKGGSDRADQSKTTN